MLDKMLNTITDSSDYLAAISLFQLKKPMTKADTKRLLGIYAKYVPGADDPVYARACLAVDMLSGRTEEDRAYFAPLELGDENLDALFYIKEILNQDREITRQEAQKIVERVQDKSLDLYAQVLLARTALNVLAYNRDFVDIRDEVTALAEFLTSCGSEVLDRYGELVGEVRCKCRK